MDEGQFRVERLCKLDANVDCMRGHRAFADRDKNSLETHLSFSNTMHPRQLCGISSPSQGAVTIPSVKSRRNPGTGLKPAASHACMDAAPAPFTLGPAWFCSASLMPVTEQRGGEGCGPSDPQLHSEILIQRQPAKQPETGKRTRLGCRLPASGYPHQCHWLWGCSPRRFF